MKVALYYYRDIAEKLTFSDKIEPSVQNKLDYLVFIDHESFSDLSKYLEKSRGICPEESHTSLGHLRVSFDFRRANTGILMPNMFRLMKRSKVESFFAKHH